jgi:hypothetical protein
MVSVGRRHGRLPSLEILHAFTSATCDSDLALQWKDCGLGWRRLAPRATPSTPRGIGRRFRSEAGFSDSDQDMTDLLSIDRPLFPVADQHVAARGRKLWAIFLEAGQNGKIALIHQLAAETLRVAGACLLLLLRAAMSQGVGRNRDGQQDERQEEFVHVLPPTDFRQPSDPSSPGLIYHRDRDRSLRNDTV